jgi:hypothetical protein
LPSFLSNSIDKKGVFKLEIEDEFLKAQLNKYSIYRKEFVTETKHEDILMVILRVHMYIEKEMVELTKIYFNHPSKLEKYTFKSRLDLLYALGVIEKELYDPIRVINDIRNKISHKLDFKFTDMTYKKLSDSLSKDILNEFKKDLESHSLFNKNPNCVDKMKLMLSGIWTRIKAEVLISFISKRELAAKYIEEANNQLIEFKKNQI